LPLAGDITTKLQYIAAYCSMSQIKGYFYVPDNFVDVDWFYSSRVSFLT